MSIVYTYDGPYRRYYTKTENLYISISYYNINLIETINYTYVKTEIIHQYDNNAGVDGNSDWQDWYTVTSYSSFNLRSVPTGAPTGYTYYWNTLSNGTGTSYSSQFSYNANGSITSFNLYLTQVVNNYILTYNYQGKGTTTSVNVSYNSLLIRPNADAAGYNFLGWSLNPSLGPYNAANTQFNMPASDITFYAGWTARTYTATWNYNGGTGSPATSTATYAALLTIPTTPTKSGYTFTGWNDGIATVNVNYINQTLIYNYTSNTTFTAQWTVSTYTATWNYNGGTGSPATSTATYAALLTIPTTPTKSGYTFTGWNDGTTTYTANFTYNYTSVKTFTAQWTVITYTVSYNKYGGTTSSDPTLATYNEPFTLPTITKTNYTFDGWYTNNIFSGTRYTTSSFIWTLTENTTFHAKFTINNFNLTYNSNYIGTGKVITVIGGTTITLLTLKAVGYTFEGWYTNQATTQPTSKLTSPYTMPLADTILYAKWTDNTLIRISDLLNTYGNIDITNTNTSIKEYQTTLEITANSRTSFKDNLKGKGPVPP